MSYPEHLKYTRDHEWLFTEDGATATIGVTDYAIEQLGDIVHLDLPEVGDEFDAGASFGTIESTKTVSDLYCPVTAKIVEINDDILDNLEGLAEDPYDDGWLLKIAIKNESELDELMNAKEYDDFISEQED